MQQGFRFLSEQYDSGMSTKVGELDIMRRATLASWLEVRDARLCWCHCGRATSSLLLKLCDAGSRETRAGIRTTQKQVVCRAAAPDTARISRQKVWRHVHPFRHNTGIGQTDRQTDGFAITISRSACIICWRAIRSLRWTYETNCRPIYVPVSVSL